jgi:hypothetical protein
MNRLEELLLLWQDQSITEEQGAELKQLLASPEARAKAAEDFFLTGVLLEAVRAQSAAQREASPALQPSAAPSRSPTTWLGRRAAWLAGLAAALLLALGGVFWFQPAPAVRGPAMVFAQVQGETFVVGTKQQLLPAQAGQVLVPGQGITTQGAGSEAVVEMEDAVRLKLASDTTLFTATEAEEAGGGPKLVLEQGEVSVEVTRSLGKKRMSLQTPLGMVVAETEQTALHVSEAAGVVVVRGEVSFTHKATGKSIQLKGGQYVVATEDGDLYAAQFFAPDPHVWSTFPAGFTDTVSVAFSADGRLLAAATHSRDATGIRLGAPEGEAPSQLPGDRCIALSPDGQLLAAGEWGKVMLYETATGKLLRVLEKRGQRVRVSCLAFSPDGQALAVGKGSRDGGGDLEMWDVKTGELAWFARGHVSGINAVAFAPDGKRLASGSWDKTVVVWDTAARQEKTRLLMVPALVVRSLAFAPDGQTLAIATGPGDPRIRQPGEIKLWDVATETVRTTLRGHGRTVTSLAYAADGQTLVSGSADTTVRFWDLATHREYAMLKGHKAAVGFEGLGVAVSPDGTWLATISFDHTIKLWKVAWMKKDLPAKT